MGSRRKQGFSLIELCIVLGVAGVIIGGVIAFTGNIRQKSRLELSRQAIMSVVDQTRAAYGGQSAITGTVAVMVPRLVQLTAIPSDMARSSTTSCNGTAGNYADSPWGANSDVCGTFRVCSWAYGTETVCNAGAASQFFAIEFAHLDFAGCMLLTQSILPTQPPGLKDVYINGVSTASTGLPPSSTAASTNCAKTYTNIIDFVYKLRVTGT